jgi:hypothetical protein
MVLNKSMNCRSYGLVTKCADSIYLQSTKFRRRAALGAAQGPRLLDFIYGIA